MIFEQKICYMFNKFFSSFIKDLKSMDDSLKATIKKNYKVIDKSSEEYFNLFWGSVSTHLKAFVDGEDLDKNETVMGLEIVKGITIGDAMNALKEEDKSAFWNYMNILLVFAYLYNEATEVEVAPPLDDSDVTQDENDDDLNAESTDNAEPKEAEPAASGVYMLFVKFVRILSMVQKGEDATSELQDIIDDDVRKLSSKIKTFATTDGVKIDETADTLPVPPTEFMESIENSKIANLAKEISQEIDITNLKFENPEDIAKLMDFSGSNNFLGDIVSKVSTKLTEKISSGELKQEDLMSEAMSMMSMLNGGGAGGAGGIADMLKGMGGLGGLGNLMNNPMMAEMMKMAKKGKTATKNTGGTRRGSSSTRDRLRKKLDEKKKQTDSSS